MRDGLGHPLADEDYEPWYDDPHADEAAKPGEPVCEVDGENVDTYGGEHYWHCDRPGTITVDGTLMCEDHAGERGYGPKQEEHGFDPDDGLNPASDPARETGRQRAAELLAKGTDENWLGI